MSTIHAAPRVVFKVLGPLEVSGESGAAVDVCGKPAKLLALLLLHANSWVPVQQIPDALWSRKPPASADRNIKTYIWQLRRSLPPMPDGSARLEGKRGGYRIRVLRDELDTAVFEDAVRFDDGDASAEVVVRRLQAVLDLWRGAPFAEVPEVTARLSVVRLEQLRWQLFEQLADAYMADAKFLDAVSVLQPLTAEDPLREGLWSRLVLALNGAGLRAEALAAYQSARRTLVEELGVEPGVALQEAHRSVLDGDGPAADDSSRATDVHAAIDATSTAPRRRRPEVADPSHFGRPFARPVLGAAPVAPRPLGVVDRVITEDVDAPTDDIEDLRWAAFDEQPPSFLPRDVPDFVGRTHQVDLLERAASRITDTPTVAVVEGMPGVGKSALAVHVAHRLRALYPGGQIFCDLHGHDGDAAPTDPADLLGGLLEAVGVPPQSVPVGLDRRAALWRSLLTGRRVLLVLDDAASAAQVRPLLPGSGDCLALVTSRRRLSELDGVLLVEVDPLPDADALELLTTASRTDSAEPLDIEAARSVVRLCGNLPAAIRIAASRLRQHPFWDFASMSERLRCPDTRLGELRTGDRDIAATLRMSYARLDDDAQDVLRVLAAASAQGRRSHGGADFRQRSDGADSRGIWGTLHVETVSSLMGRSVLEIEHTLERLLDHHLVAQFSRDHYGIHVLVEQVGLTMGDATVVPHRREPIGADVGQTA